MKCANCGHENEHEATHCANCGALMPYPDAAGYQKSRGTDPLEGFVLGIVLMALLGIGFVVCPIIYFSMRRRRPAFANGIGLAWLLPILALLGLLAMCMVPSLLFKGIYHK